MNKEEQIKDLKAKIAECERIIEEEMKTNPIPPEDWMIKHYSIRMSIFKNKLLLLEKEPINMSKIYCKGA